MKPIILAAGKGTRMKASVPKPLVPVEGVPMLRRIVETLEKTPSCELPLIVIGHQGEEVQKAMGEKYQYVDQFASTNEINGTASAVLVCLPYLQEGDTPVIILYGDHPLVSKESLEKLHAAFTKEKAVLAFATTTVPDYLEWRSLFAHYGRVLRTENGEVKGVVEYKNASEEKRALKEINPGIYCVDRVWLREALPKIKPNEKTGEYYLTDLIELANLDSQRVITVSIEPHEAVGVNTPEDAMHAEMLVAKHRL